MKQDLVEIKKLAKQFALTFGINTKHDSTRLRIREIHTCGIKQVLSSIRNAYQNNNDDNDTEIPGMYVCMYVCIKEKYHNIT